MFRAAYQANFHEGENRCIELRAVREPAYGSQGMTAASWLSGHSQSAHFRVADAVRVC